MNPFSVDFNKLYSKIKLKAYYCMSNSLYPMNWQWELA